MMAADSRWFRILCILSLIASLPGYMEWGGGQHSFVIQAEVLVVSKIFTDFTAVFHPLIVLPLAGQVLLLIAAAKGPSLSSLVIIGIALLCVLHLLILIAGSLSGNAKMILSVIPFLTLSFVTLRFLINKRKATRRALL